MLFFKKGWFEDKKIRSWEKKVREGFGKKKKKSFWFCLIFCFRYVGEIKNRGNLCLVFYLDLLGGTVVGDIKIILV